MTAGAASFTAAALAAARAATGRLGWPPAAFWAATPAELRLALEGLLGPPAPPPATRADLRRLQEMLPDG